MRRANVLPIALMAFALVAFLFVLDYSINDYRLPWSTKIATKNSNIVACTQEAMVCPDGSFVGRSGPNCEFDACPTGTTKNTNSSVNTNSPNDNTHSDINTNTKVKSSLLVSFVDQQTHAPIANIGFSLYSDNGVRCVTTPCPTNGRTMLGTTDSKGMVNVPAEYVDASMTFTLNGYQSKEVHSGTLQDDGSWKLSLTQKT